MRQALEYCPGLGVEAKYSRTMVVASLHYTQVVPTY